MIGRKAELRYLEEMSKRTEAQLIAVFGRRRIGKTYLVRKCFSKRLLFEHTGLFHVNLAGQLLAFRDSLRRAGLSKIPRFSSWHDAFLALEELIRQHEGEKRIVFLDELPWMDTPKSNFVPAFEAFWNGWASAQSNLMIVFCGSATSWVINKVLKNRGGLHNRVTGTLPLAPFSLLDCREYAEAMGLPYTDMDIAEAYMVFGGIPYYWSFLRKGESFVQSIDRLFFSPNGQLRHEFTELYNSLFSSEEAYIRIVTALARKKRGLSLSELTTTMGTSKGGRLSRFLDELEQCGFIRRYTSWGHKKRDALFQLIDNFTLFHFSFLNDDTNQDSQFWSKSTTTPTVSTWKGLAFERLCLQHIDQIKKALGISGVLTKVYSWRHQPNEIYPQGAQIDLLIERADRVVNICEMKWCNGLFAIDKETDANLRSKVNTFRNVTGCKLATHLTLLTPDGTLHNKYWNSIQSEVTLAELFA